ncbi:MAG: hypothetical protein V1755_05685 [Chloroflexota bacterium]
MSTKEMTALDLLTRLEEAGIRGLYLQRWGELADGARGYRLSADDWSFERPTLAGALEALDKALDGYSAYREAQARANAAEEADFRRWCAEQREKELVIR